jgi:hypothetical protein
MITLLQDKTEELLLWFLEKAEQAITAGTIIVWLLLAPGARAWKRYKEERTGRRQDSN